MVGEAREPGGSVQTKNLIHFQSPVNTGFSGEFQCDVELKVEEVEDGGRNGDKDDRKKAPGS